MMSKLIFKKIYCWKSICKFILSFTGIRFYIVKTNLSNLVVGGLQKRDNVNCKNEVIQDLYEKHIGIIHKKESTAKGSLKNHIQN